MVSKNLKGKTVWITGGKRIGKEIAYSLAKLGANLILTYRFSEKEARETEKKIRKFGNKVFVYQCDISSEKSVEETVSRIKEDVKKLDILILLASVFEPVKLENINDKDWNNNISVHIKGVFWPIKFSLPLMKPGSHIITVADRTSVGKIYPGYLPYVVTKSAVMSMTRALAIELGPRGIFINSIAPGPILRPDDISEGEWQKIRDSSIIKYPITDKEAVQEFIDTVIRLCFVRSSGGAYPLDLGHF